MQYFILFETITSLSVLSVFSISICKGIIENFRQTEKNVVCGKSFFSYIIYGGKFKVEDSTNINSYLGYNQVS